MARCSDYNLITYLDGIVTKEETACVGNHSTYTTSTTLPGTVTYKWYLDSVVPPSPVLGTKSDFTYTFDDQSHKLYVIAKSSAINCAIQTDISVEGIKCPDGCKIDCIKEEVSFPAGRLTQWVDKYGNITYLVWDATFECAKVSAKNDEIVRRLKTLLNAHPNCLYTDIRVTWRFNKTGPYCITLTIENSPIKFMSLNIGTTTYNFNTYNC